MLAADEQARAQGIRHSPDGDAAPRGSNQCVLDFAAVGVGEPNIGAEVDGAGRRVDVFNHRVDGGVAVGCKGYRVAVRRRQVVDASAKRERRSIESGADFFCKSLVARGARQLGFDLAASDATFEADPDLAQEQVGE